MKTRKRFIGTLISVILLFTINITTFANWIPDYYNPAYFWADEKHYTDAYGFQIELNDSYKESEWFTNYFNGAYEWKWIYNPQAPIRRWDFLRFIYNMQMNAYPDLEYKNIAPNYMDITEDPILCKLFYDMSKVLFANNIYIGEEINTYSYKYTSNLYSTLTRSQLATILVNANNSWWHLEPIRKSKNFLDISNEINKENIIKAYELGLMDGVSDILFNPNDFLTNEQAVLLANKIAIKLYSYEIFIETMNLNDVVKITESYSQYYDLSPKFATEGIVYMPGPPRGYGPGYFAKSLYPTRDSIMYDGKTKTLHLLAAPNGLTYGFNVNAFITNNITYNTVSIINDQTNHFTTNIDGMVYPKIWGETDIIISNKYGSDTLHIISHSDCSEYSKKPRKEIN